MRTAAELLRITGTLAVVLGTTALVLAVADAVPARLTGIPSGLVRYQSVEEAQRRLGLRLLVPVFFPDSLAWPPARVEALAGPPAWVALVFAGRDGGGERLRLLQGWETAATPPPDLWPAARWMGSRRVDIGAVETALVRALGADGRFWHELSFDLPDRRIALRANLPIEDLLRIARSLEHARP